MIEQRQHLGIGHGTLATGVGLLFLVVMLASVGNREAKHFPPLPDFSAYTQARDMKGAFIDYLTPIIYYHNEQVLNERKRLIRFDRAITAGRALARSESRWLKQLAKKYKVEWNRQKPGETTGELLAKVDIVPVQLAIVQAAKESSWGRSRFAVQSNNIFGQWCYQRGCGQVPLRRSGDSRHEVRQFASISDSIQSYIHNLNSHHRYSDLRRLRQILRQRGEAIDGSKLVDGLLYYSERRQDYVEEIRSMLRQHRFFQNQRRALAGI